MSWCAEEFADLDLRDKRLNDRAIKMMEDFARQPMASIPAACGGWAETQAAYRLLGNEKVHWQEILAPHWQRSEERIATHPVVLCLQDTTELDFHGQGIAGLGRLSYDADFGDRDRLFRSIVTGHSQSLCTAIKYNRIGHDAALVSTMEEAFRRNDSPFKEMR